MALEAVTKQNPGAGYVQLQPNPGGIQGWRPSFKTVERNPLSPFATPEKGDNVGLDVAITIQHDLNKDFADVVQGPLLRCNLKHPGNKGQSLYRPTGVTATGYTVPALGDLAQYTLIYARGFDNAANNGMKVVGAGSVAGEIKAPGLVVEAGSATNANATVDVIGAVASIAADIQIDANNNLISTVADFTTMGLAVGDWVAIGGTAAGSFLATVPSKSRARIKAITAHKLTLGRHSWVVAGADAAPGVSLQLFFGRFARNYATNDAVNYKKQSFYGELLEPGATLAGADAYTYAEGLAPDSMDIDAPSESKIVATLKLVGLNVKDPTNVRAAGPATAYAPQATNLLNTADEVKLVRLTDANGTLVGEINSWKLTLSNSVKKLAVQGTLGGNKHSYGSFTHTVTMEAYYDNSDVMAAIHDRRALSWDAYVENDQFGILFDLPYVALRNGDKKYQEHEPVMITCDVPAFRNAADGIAGAIIVFGYLPQ
jgi:hypothetical protein